MSLDGAWIPQNEEENRLMEDLHIATRRAHSDGVSRTRIAGLLAFMASATLDPASELDAQQRSESRTIAEAFEEAMAESDSGREPEDCPNCGTTIGRVMASMGGEHHVKPCNCTFTYEEAEEGLGDHALLAGEDRE